MRGGEEVSAVERRKQESGALDKERRGKMAEERRQPKKETRERRGRR